MFGHIIMKAIGVFDIPLDSSAKPIRQIKIKDIFDNDNYKVLLYTTENRVHIYAFEQDTRGIYTNSDKPFLLDNSVAHAFAKFIYSYGYYKIRFTPIIYSLEDDMHDVQLFPEDVIDVYDARYIPNHVYSLVGDLFKRISVISHLLYRFEINYYINNIEKL